MTALFGGNHVPANLLDSNKQSVLLAVTAITSRLEKVGNASSTPDHSLQRLSVANKDAVINQTDDVLAPELAEHTGNRFS